MDAAKMSEKKYLKKCHNKEGTVIDQELRKQQVHKLYQL